MNKKDPRTQNGHRRKQLRKRYQQLGLPCALCGQPIDYSLTYYIDPKDGKKKRHPMSLEIDEIVPTAEVLKNFGYEAAVKNALSFEGTQPVHRICNLKKGAKTRARMQNMKVNESVCTPIPHYIDI